MYRIPDTDGANLAGDFPSQDEALLYVCDAIALNGKASIQDLALAHVGAGKPIASGISLAKLALERFPQAKRSA